MFRVTLYHLDPKTNAVSADIGIQEIGKLPGPDLLMLLTRFCQIDPAENARTEPEIRVEINGSRHIFQTGSGKLHLYNGRDRQAPALVLTPAEALTEFTRPPPAPRAVAPSRASDDRPPVALAGSEDLVYVA